MREIEKKTAKNGNELALRLEKYRDIGFTVLVGFKFSLSGGDGHRTEGRKEKRRWLFQRNYLRIIFVKKINKHQ